jgi:starch-binding outer membrane protein, SusD/RagB family
MKKIKYIALGLIGLLGTTSCEKYLTVNPKTQMTQTVLFSTQNGFKDALTGAYIQFKSNTIYGQNLTMTTLEQLISNWDVTTNTTEQKLGLFNYTDASVDALMTSIYTQEYKVISSVNAILAQIDANKAVFTTPGMYELIKGECLALRAYCHFDVLRIWGPIPSSIPTGNSMPPYVTALSNSANPLISYSQYQALLLQDLKDAEDLLKPIDPILSYSLLDLGRPGSVTVTTFNPSDTYFAYRYLRMNYYAVKALQARANLWFGKPADAYAAAKVVISALNPDGSVKFRLGIASDMTAATYALPSEHVFGIYDFGLNTKYTNLFANGTLKKGTAATTVTSQLYGSTGTDIREVSLWLLITQANQAKTYICQKYNVPATAGSGFADLNRIPLLRLSEMYFIAIETTTDAAEAQTLWAAFRTARNVTVSTLPTDPMQVQAALVTEYRKEFVAEGQAFFAYKRLNTIKTNFLWCPTAATPNYLFPMPKTESLATN